MTKAVMIDLETLGVTAECAIVSIGAVIFNPYSDKFIIDKSFYQPVRLLEQKQRVVSEKTLGWWMEQSDEARSVFNDPTKWDIKNSLEALWFFMANPVYPNEVWSMGADFDIAILTSAYSQFGVELPWKHGVQRCFRTLKNLYPEIKSPVDTVKHNALADAIAQAEWCWHIMQVRKEQMILQELAAKTDTPPLSVVQKASIFRNGEEGAE